MDPSPFEPLVAAPGPTAQTPLAPLDRRFLAALVDRVAVAATFVPAVAAASTRYEPDLTDGVVVAGVVATLVALALLTAFQWTLLTTRGQTIGKRAFDIRVVKVDGSAVDFVSAVVLRVWIVGFVTGIANNLCLGWVVILADVLPIFGQERRCLHDRIAGTIVIAE